VVAAPRDPGRKQEHEEDSQDSHTSNDGSLSSGESSSDEDDIEAKNLRPTVNEKGMGGELVKIGDSELKAGDKVEMVKEN
jgi:hypothetical protein